MHSIFIDIVEICKKQLCLKMVMSKISEKLYCIMEFCKMDR